MSEARVVIKPGMGNEKWEMRKWGNDEIAEYQSFLVELHRTSGTPSGTWRVSPSILNDLFTFSRHNISSLADQTLTLSGENLILHSATDCSG